MSSKFHTTSWSNVLAARDADLQRSREALSELCAAYWSPLYSFVRHRGYSAEDARDLTQDYFARLIEKDYLRRVNRDSGKFRTFLLMSLKRFLANERDRANALKRAPDRPILSLDFDTAERKFREEPKDDRTPEMLYERQWALMLLGRVVQRLRRESVHQGKARQFELLKPYLVGEEPATPYRQVAAELGTSEDAVKMAVHRMRKRFGRILREEVAQTVEDPQAIDGEIHTLLGAIRH